MATSIQQISVDPQQVRIFEWTKHLRVPIDRIAADGPASQHLARGSRWGVCEAIQTSWSNQIPKEMNQSNRSGGRAVRASLVEFYIDASETIQPYSRQTGASEQNRSTGRVLTVRDGLEV